MTDYLSVIPAKAGIQGGEPTTVALDPRFRGDDDVTYEEQALPATRVRGYWQSVFYRLRHVLKNALPPVMAVMGLQFGYLIGGSILVETVFTWPGSGFLLSKAIINRDVPVLQGTILTLAMVFVAVNLIVDLLQSLVDPRIRRG